MSSKVETTDLDSEWADALNDVYGTDLTSTVDPSKAKEDEEEEEDEHKEEEEHQDDDASKDDKKEDESKEEDESKDDDSKKEEEDDDSKKEDSKKEDEDDDSKEDDSEKEEEEEDKKEDEQKENESAASPKDALKEALRELDEEKKETEETRKAIQKEVLDTLYPEGLDRQLYDSEGDPINGIDDLTKLINPKTGELFTEEEAGAWLLSAQKELNKTIEQIENYVEGVAETHLTLKESSIRVEQKWGEILKKFPDVADKVLTKYQESLVKDKKTGIVIKAPFDMAEFYDIALSGYAKLAEQMNEVENGKAEQAERERAEKEKVEQRERSDLHGASSTSRSSLSDKDEEWKKAYEDYYNE